MATEWLNKTISQNRKKFAQKNVKRNRRCPIPLPKLWIIRMAIHFASQTQQICRNWFLKKKKMANNNLESPRISTCSHKNSSASQENLLQSHEIADNVQPIPIETGWNPCTRFSGNSRKSHESLENVLKTFKTLPKVNPEGFQSKIWCYELLTCCNIQYSIEMNNETDLRQDE